MFVAKKQILFNTLLCEAGDARGALCCVAALSDQGANNPVPVPCPHMGHATKAWEKG